VFIRRHALGRRFFVEHVVPPSLHWHFGHSTSRTNLEGGSLERDILGGDQGIARYMVRSLRIVFLLSGFFYALGAPGDFPRSTGPVYVRCR